MTRVTADSNIFVSALIFGGKPQQLLERAIDGTVILAISEAIRDEVLRVLRDKFQRSPEQLAQAQRYIQSLTSLVTPTETLEVVSADPTDNRILECALAASSEAIVSGDQHLLAIGNFRGIEVMTDAEFLRRHLRRVR